MTALSRLLAVCLLVGTALVCGGGAVHPALRNDAPSQLRAIAAAPHWRVLHLAMLGGSALVIAGIWVRLIQGGESLDRGRLASITAALGLIALGLTLNALNIAYMAGAGWHLATAFARGDQTAIALFEATHGMGLMAARFGNLLVALGALVMGCAEWSDAGVPRVTPVLAWSAAAAGLVGAACFGEGSPLVLAAVAVLSGWQVATAVRALSASWRVAPSVRAA